MKIIVDDMPKTSSECIFSYAKPSEKRGFNPDDKVFCALEFNKRFCVCHIPREKCPFLIGLNDMVPSAYPNTLSVTIRDSGMFERMVQDRIDEIKSCLNSIHKENRNATE